MIERYIIQIPLFVISSDKLSFFNYQCCRTIGCSFKFPVKVGVEVGCERTTDY
jgi:hypothetical protein